MENINIDNLGGKRDMQSFLAGVFGYFGLAIAISALGAYTGLFIVAAINPTIALIGAFVLKLALIFTANMWVKKTGLNILLFTVMAFLGGVLITPILAIMLTSDAGLAIGVQALLASSGLFLLMGLFGAVTKIDLSKIATIAFFAMIIIIVLGLLNAFIFKMGILGLVISSVAVVIFSIFTAYDIQSIKNGEYDSAMLAAINLYLDFVGLFKAIFSILWGLFAGND